MSFLNPHRPTPHEQSLILQALADADREATKQARAAAQANYYRTDKGQKDLTAEGRFIELLFVASPDRVLSV